MRLSKRLAAVVSLVEPSFPTADIGADHAKVALELLNTRRVPFVFAVENKEGPYLKMKEALGEGAEEGTYEASLSDGVSELPSSVKSVVMAGMGCDLILSILDKNKEKTDGITYLVIDSHNEWGRLREELAMRHWAVCNEVFLKDAGIYYDVMSFRKSETPVSYTKLENEFGPLACHERNSDWKEYMMGEKTRLEGLLGLSSVSNPKKKAMGERLNLIEEALK